MEKTQTNDNGNNKGKQIMKRKIRKYAILTPYIMIALFLLYLLPYGAIDRTQAFGKWLNGGMSPKQVKYISCVGQLEPNRVTLSNEVLKKYKEIK